MIRPYRLVLCIVLIAGFCSGCSTIESLSSDDPSAPKIYGGVRLHLKGQSEAEEGSDQLGGKIVSAIFDLPFSAILDTLLLPVTVFLEPASPEERMQDSKREEREKERERRREQKRRKQENRETEWSRRTPAEARFSSAVS